MEEHKEKKDLELYPVGSVVIAKGNVKKLVIIGRGVIVQVQEKMYFFDYAAVLYPEGMLNDRITYFNHKDIYKVVQEGYADEDEEMMRETILEWIQQTDIPRGDARQINASRILQNRKKTEG